MSDMPRPLCQDLSAEDGSQRRRFLQTAAGTLAAAALAGCATSKPGETISAGSGPIPKGGKRVPLSPGEEIKIGVIGLSGPGQGGMGVGHCNAFTTLVKQGKENARIVAICDVNQLNIENAQNVLAKAGASQPADTYTDYKKVLARPDIHGVLIATPEHWHAQMAIDALGAGKDVYLEKPMTLRLGEALRLREVVLANPDLRLQVGTQMTNLPKYHEARKVIARGDIGAVVSSQTSYCRNSKGGEWNYYVLKPEWKPGAQWTPGQNLDWDAWCGPLGKQPWDPALYSRWRRYRKTSTGICGDLLVHVVTPMLVALGPDVGWPVRVVATGSHMVDKAMENHDNVQITVLFENGHQMVITGSTSNEVGLETLIRGHRGNIYLGGRNCVVRPERIYSEEMDEQTINCPDIGNDQDAHRLKWMNVMRTREQPDSDVNQGAKVMIIMDLATRSMWENAAFAFDPKSMTARKLA